MRTTVFILPLLLAACVDGSAPLPGNPSVGRTLAAQGGACPNPDPVRDGPLVDAIRNDDATTVEAVLRRDPADSRALTALAIISGEGSVDANQAACFAPYL